MSKILDTEGTYPLIEDTKRLLKSLGLKEVKVLNFDRVDDSSLENASVVIFQKEGCTLPPEDDSDEDSEEGLSEDASFGDLEDEDLSDNLEASEEDTSEDLAAGTSEEAQVQQEETTSDSDELPSDFRICSKCGAVYIVDDPKVWICGECACPKKALQRRNRLQLRRFTPRYAKVAGLLSRPTTESNCSTALLV